jgi:hypothetical protein
MHFAKLDFIPNDTAREVVAKDYSIKIKMLLKDSFGLLKIVPVGDGARKNSARR